jgi:hypothetical protein
MQDFSAEFTLSESKGLEMTPRFARSGRISTIPEGDTGRGLALQPTPASRQPREIFSVSAIANGKKVSWAETEFASALGTE